MHLTIFFIIINKFNLSLFIIHHFNLLLIISLILFNNLLRFIHLFFIKLIRIWPFLPYLLLYHSNTFLLTLILLQLNKLIYLLNHILVWYWSILLGFNYWFFFLRLLEVYYFFNSFYYRFFFILLITL